MPAADQSHLFFVAILGSSPARILVWNTRKIRVGRASDNDLCIDNVEISRHHSVFTRDGDVPVVENLSETNETFVNDEPIRRHGLANGDRVRICNLELVFHQESRSPFELGLPVEFVSQIGPWSHEDDANASGATMLGFGESLVDLGGAIATRPSSSETPRALDPSGALEPVVETRDLDAEFEDLAWESLVTPGRPIAPVISGPAKADSIVLRLRIRCRNDDMRTAVLALVGRSLELPGLRVDVESDDGF